MNKEHIAVVLGLLLVVGLAWAGGANFDSVVASIDGAGKSLVAGAGTLVNKAATDPLVTLSGVAAKPVVVTAPANGESKNITLTSFGLRTNQTTTVSEVTVNVIKTGPAVINSASIYLGSEEMASLSGSEIPTQLPGKAFALKFPLDWNPELIAGEKTPRVFTVKADIKGATAVVSTFRASVAPIGVKGSPSAPFKATGSMVPGSVTIKTNAPAPVKPAVPAKPAVKAATTTKTTTTTR